MSTVRKLGRTTSQRKAMLRCLATQVLIHGKIKTTETRAKEAKKIVEPGKNGYLVHMDLSDLDIDKIFNHIPADVTYVDRCDYDKWEKVFKGEL